MGKVLGKEFFERPTLVVARGLLGKTLVRSLPGRSGGRRREIRATIVEVEAYDGYRDKASHAYRGKTARNCVMFGEFGVWYVYFVYGMYQMLNIVTGPEGYPAAVLLRAVVTEDGVHINGPGKLTRELSITKKENGMRATRISGLWIEEGTDVPRGHILRTPRIGVTYAKEWAEKPYRFVLKNLS